MKTIKTSLAVLVVAGSFFATACYYNKDKSTVLPTPASASKSDVTAIIGRSGCGCHYVASATDMGIANLNKILSVAPAFGDSTSSTFVIGSKTASSGAVCVNCHATIPGTNTPPHGYTANFDLGSFVAHTTHFYDVLVSIPSAHPGGAAPIASLTAADIATIKAWKANPTVVGADPTFANVQSTFSILCGSCHTLNFAWLSSNATTIQSAMTNPVAHPGGASKFPTISVDAQKLFNAWVTAGTPNN